MSVSKQEILDAARKLGEFISRSDESIKYKNALESLNENIQAKNLIDDLNRHIEYISEKEARQQPIEVEDKRKLEKLRGDVAQDPLLRNLQLTQMNYVDLMRQVDQAISSAGTNTNTSS